MLPANYAVTITGFAADSAYEYKNDCTITKNVNGASVTAKVVVKMLDLNLEAKGNGGDAVNILTREGGFEYNKDYRFKCIGQANWFKFVATEAGWYTFEYGASEGCDTVGLNGARYWNQSGTLSNKRIVSNGAISSSTSDANAACGVTLGDAVVVGTDNMTKTITLYLGVGDTVAIGGKAYNDGTLIQTANVADMTIKVTQDKTTPAPTV